MTCVIDASTLLKSAAKETDEEDAAAARAIQPPLAEKFGFSAPQLLAWEVANVIHHKSRPSDRTSAERAGRLAILLDGIEQVPAEEIDWATVGGLCEEHGLTAYDASYLALALGETEGILVTEDEDLLEAGRSELGVDRAHSATTALNYVEDGLL